MKFELVTKRDKRNTSTLKSIDGDAMLTNRDVIAFSNLRQFCSHLKGGFRMHAL